MNRRSFVLNSVALSSVLVPNASSAFFSCGPYPNAKGEIYSGELWDGLAHTLWVPMGPQDRETTVYALIAPWCPFCTRLTSDAIEGKLGFNLRALPCEPRGFSDQKKIYNLLTQPGAASISAFHDRRPDSSVRVSDQKRMRAIINFQQETFWSALQWQSAIWPDTFAGFPLIAFSRTDGPPLVFGGYSPEIANNLSKESRSVITAGHKIEADDVFMTTLHDNRPLSVVPNAKGARLRVFPSVNSLPAECTSPDFSYDVAGTLRWGGEDWFVVEYDNYNFRSLRRFGRSQDFSVL